ncbi:pyridoxal phosphate-dependent transferase [Aspergillus navahoensis]
MALNMDKNDFQTGANDYSLNIALNYGQGTCSAQMLQLLIHNPRYADWGCCLTTGNTSAWDSALRMFCEEGDYIIVDEYSFSSALERAWALGIKTLSVAMDAQGLIPSGLDSVLGNWDPESQRARKPFLLNMVQTGQNPTGAVQSIERREANYALAQKHGFEALNQLCPLVPSYLSLDIDGRVLRLDSLSKVLAPGCLLGNQQVIEKFIRQNETSAQHQSGFSQVIDYSLLNHVWGHLGFVPWLEYMQAEYTWRRDTLAQACMEALPRHIASWCPPQAGMFQWIEIDWKSHPLYKAGASHREIEQRVLTAAVERKVFLTPGSCFWSAGDTSEQGRMFFRTTFATASRGELREAARRFGDALRIQFQSDAV